MLHSLLGAFRKPTIRDYLVLMNLVLLALLFPSISFYFFYEEGKFRDLQLQRTIAQLRKSLESRGASLARSMALSSSQAIAGYDFTFLNIMVGQVVAEDPEISYCLIVGLDNQVITHSNTALIGTTLNSTVDREINRLVAEHFPAVAGPTNQSGQVVFYDMPSTPATPTKGSEIMEAIAPLYNGQELWGALRLGYSMKRLQGDIEVVRSEWDARMLQFNLSLVSITVFFVGLGVLLATRFTHSLVRSVQVLNNGVNRISVGDLNHTINQHGLVCSEVMELSTAFNDMTTKLRGSYQQLDEYSRSLEQKVDQRTLELREAQSRLMRQAHEAGMSEMAVGILHNIGNAITPAKVSAVLLHKKINSSKVQLHIQEVMNQLRPLVDAANLPIPEKQRFAELLNYFPTALRGEYAAFATDVEQIRNKHEHIEGIINLQMRYARLFGDFEEIDLNTMIEDALEMLRHSLYKREITLVREFGVLPKIKIEKAKLIQIIVNLLKNSYEALDQVDRQGKQIKITTKYDPGPPRYVILSIEDNGIGFSPTEKDKLFVFGYTTKAKGSGFGLHSCANFLIANNGAITAQSDGKGKGAEFIIRLAVDRNGEAA